MLNIVLYEPEIPQNTGNIIRTCAAIGAKLHLIEPLGFSLDEKYVKRSGVNYLEYCQMVTYENYDKFIELNKNGEYYFLTRYGKKRYSDIDYRDVDKDIYLIFGKESTGIPKEILQANIDNCLRIPTTDNVRALNLSNCVALMSYEVLKQRDFPNLLDSDSFKIDYLNSNEL